MKKYLLTLSILPLAVVAITFIFYRGAFGANPAPHHDSTNDLFYNYTTWTHTGTVGIPAILVSSSGGGSSASYSSNPNKFTFTDINGDNLPDFVYHEKQYDLVNRPLQFFAIFLNNGNSNFNLAYKCVTIPSNGSYGDCSAAPFTDPNAPANQNKLTQVLYLANFVNPYGGDVYPYTRVWIDINGDGLQDFIDYSLHINTNNGFPYLNF